MENTRWTEGNLRNISLASQYTGQCDITLLLINLFNNLDASCLAPHIVRPKIVNSSVCFKSYVQARAPNSPVLIVGTHFDKMREQYPASRSEDLQQLIREKYENEIHEIYTFQS